MANIGLVFISSSGYHLTTHSVSFCSFNADLKCNYDSSPPSPTGFYRYRNNVFIYLFNVKEFMFVVFYIAMQLSKPAPPYM